MRKFGSASERGYALVVAVWVVGLLALMTLSFTGAVRSHLRGTSATVGSATAEALAEAGINLAILDLLASGTGGVAPRRFPLDGTKVACSVEGGGRVVTAISDLAGRVDLNAASERLLQALLIAAGVEPRRSAELAAAIADYRDADSDRRPSGAEAQDYAAAGVLNRPRNAPFASVSEISQVLGVSASLADRLRDHVTVLTGQSGIDPVAAPPGLVEALTIAAKQAPAQAAGLGIQGPGGLSAFGDFPPDFATRSERRAFIIASEGHTGRFAFAREAILEFTPGQPRPYRIAGWAVGTVGTVDAAGGAAPERC